MSEFAELTSDFSVHETYESGDSGIIAAVGEGGSKYGSQLVFVWNEQALQELNKSGSGHPDFGTFVSYLLCARRIELYESMHGVGPLYNHIGATATSTQCEKTSWGILRLPTAQHINNALDDLPRHDGFRFYHYEHTLQNRGRVLGQEFNERLSQGEVPMGNFGWQGLYYHDFFQHGLAYLGYGSRKVAKIRHEAERMAQRPQDVAESGHLVEGSPAAKFADKVDTGSFEDQSKLICIPDFQKNFFVRRRLPLLLATV